MPVLLASAAIAIAALQPSATPAQYRSGPLPPIPTHAVGGGEVLLEVRVTRSGSVGAVTVLRSAPVFADLMMTAVQAWRFRPTEQDGPVESVVLVAAVFRPPTMTAPTLGSPSTNAAAPGRDIPFPTKMVTPPYPPQAIDNRAVLVEVRVGPSGNVTDAKVVGATSGFDGAAVQAARAWIFRPAESKSGPVTSIVYIVLDFVNRSGRGRKDNGRKLRATRSQLPARDRFELLTSGF